MRRGRRREPSRAAPRSRPTQGASGPRSGVPLTLQPWLELLPADPPPAPEPAVDAVHWGHAAAMQLFAALKAAVAVGPAVVSQLVAHAWVVQVPTHPARALQVASSRHAATSIWQVPPCAVASHMSHEAGATVPDGASFRKLVMNPLGPVSELTRLHTSEVFAVHVGPLPNEVVPATRCWLCAAPAGVSAGPPLSPSQVPGTWADPPSLDSRSAAVSCRSAGAVAVRRPVFEVLVSVTPKPTCSTSAPSVRPSSPGWATGITAVSAGAAKVNMQKS